MEEIHLDRHPGTKAPCIGGNCAGCPVVAALHHPATLASCWAPPPRPVSAETQALPERLVLLAALTCCLRAPFPAIEAVDACEAGRSAPPTGRCLLVAADLERLAAVTTRPQLLGSGSLSHSHHPTSRTLSANIWV